MCAAMLTGLVFRRVFAITMHLAMILHRSLKIRIEIVFFILGNVNNQAMLVETTCPCLLFLDRVKPRLHKQRRVGICRREAPFINLILPLRVRFQGRALKHTFVANIMKIFRLK